MSTKKHRSEVKTKFSDTLKGHLLKALEGDPQFSEAHFQLALIYQGYGDQKKAETHFKKAIELADKQTRDIEKRGRGLLKKFQFQNANVLFMKAQEKKYHCAKVNLQLSNLYENQRKSAKAQTCLKNSIQLNPSYSKAYRELGIILLKQKSYDSARLHIEKSLELDYNDCLSHFNLGIVMKKSRNYADAELHFLIAMDINPELAVCMLEMALLQLIMKNQKKAKIYYQKAQAISPDISDAKLDKVLK